MATATTSAPEARPRISAVGRIIGALFNPRATFEDIARAPSWLAPIILYCILGLAVTAIFTQRVGWEKFMRERFERSSQWSQLSPEQQQARLEGAVKTAPIFGSVFVVVANFLFPVVVAGVLMGAFRIASGAELQYKACLGIVSHANMPLGVSGLLGVLVLFLKDPATVDLENLVGSNVAAFLDSDSPRWLLSLGSSLDLFSFWVIFLLSLGFSAASPKKVTMGKALGLIVPLWVLYVLGKTGLAAAFS